MTSPLKTAVVLLLGSLPLLLLGGILGIYFLKMLSVLAFVSGALLVLYAGIRQSLADLQDPPH